MGSFSILNNISAINGQNQLNINNVNLSRTLMRLSSGRRINSGADDAAGLQIADSLRANTYALNQAVRNANDGIGICQIADGALQEITNLLTRAVTLAEEAASGTNVGGATALNNEFTSIKAEIDRIGTQTNFNGMNVLAGGSTSVFVGDLAGASGINIGFSSISSAGLGISASDLATDPTGALAAIGGAINAISTERGDFGATMNRLQSAVAVLQTQAQNTAAAESSIRDANIAEEISNLTKYQILAQSGMAALAQANSNSQNVLNLLRG